MIKAILIDDERHCNETLQYELGRNCPQISIMAVATSGADGIKAISKHRPDLIFLDVEMPGMSGFEMLRQFDELFFDVIFVTAYDKYAIEAFRCAAIDYLLKPVVSAHLVEAVHRVEERQEDYRQDLHLAALFHNLRSGMRSPRIAIPVGRGVEIINADEISHCSADSNYTHVFMQGGDKYVMARTLKDVAQLLVEADFLRVHQSHLVNMGAVQRYIRDDGGYVVMKDGTKLPIAKRRKEEFLSLLRGG